MDIWDQIESKQDFLRGTLPKFNERFIKHSYSKKGNQKVNSRKFKLQKLTKTNELKTEQTDILPRCNETINLNDVSQSMLQNVQYLSIQSIQNQMTILGCLASVKEDGLVISLPNSMEGFVSSSSLQSIIDDFVQNHNNQLSQIQDMWKVGQLVVCSVLKVNAKNKQIDLTPHPSAVNSKYNASNLKYGMVVCGLVISAGKKVKINVGIPGVQAYLHDSKQDLEKIENGEIKPHQIVRFVVRQVVTQSNTSRTQIILTTNLWTSIELCSFKPPLLEDIRPGSIVNFKPLMEVRGGINGRVCGYNASLSYLHIPQNHDLVTNQGDGFKPRPVPLILQNFYKAYVLFVSLSDTIVVSLSWQDALVTHLIPKKLPVQRKARSAKMIENISDLGCVCQLDDGLVGVIPHRVPSQREIPNNKLSVDIIERQTVDGIPIFQSQNSEFLFYLQLQSIVCGKLVHASVLKFTSLGMKVMTGDWKDGHFKSLDVLGFIPPSHVADNNDVKAEMLFTPGDVIRARVLKVDMEGNALILTAKRSLVKSELPTVSILTPLNVGMETHGVVKSINSQRIAFELYDELEGLIFSPPPFLFGKPTNPILQVGEVLVVRVLNTTAKGFLVLGFTEATMKVLKERSKTKVTDENLAQESIQNAKESIVVVSGSDVTDDVRMTLSPGQVVAAKVVGKVCEGLNVVVGKQEDEKFVSSNILGRIRNFHAADEFVRGSEKEYQLGDVIKCRVLCSDSTSDVYDFLLTNKQILVESSLPIISKFSQLKKNIITHGIIIIISKTHAFVSLYNNVCGSIQLTNLRNDKRAQLRVGKVVVARVVEFSCYSKTCSLSLWNESDVIDEVEENELKENERTTNKVQFSNSTSSQSKVISSASDVTDDVKMTLNPGQVVAAKVVGKVCEGLNVVVGRQEGEKFYSSRILGRVRNFHLGDELVGDSKKKYQIGDVIKCRVLCCDSTSYVLLTNKQILVESSLPIISEFSQLKKNIITHGIITIISKTHAFVSLYNNVCGSIQLHNLHNDKRAQLRVGKVVVVRVKDFSIETEALWLSLCNGDDVINETESHQQCSNSIPNDQESMEQVSNGDVTDDVRMTLSPGQVVMAKVVRIMREGLNVVIFHQEGERFILSRIFGRIRNFHMADELVGDSKKDCQIGDVIKCRVLSCDSTSDVLLTNKQILVESSLPIISEFSQLEKNIITHGIITMISKTHAFVSLYNNVCGAIQINDLHNRKGAQLRVGKVVVVRVKDFSIETEALWLSLCNDDDVINETESHEQTPNKIQFSNSTSSQSKVISSASDVIDDVKMTLSPGQVVAAKVVEKVREGLNVVVGRQEGEKFYSSIILGRVRNFHVADEFVRGSEKEYQIGDVMKCRVLSCDSTSDVLLTNKQLLVESSLPIISEFSQLKKNIITHGIITIISKTHAFVSLYNNVCGSVQLKNLHNDKRAQLRVGKVIEVRVQYFAVETKTLVLCLWNENDVIDEIAEYQYDVIKSKQAVNDGQTSKSVLNNQISDVVVSESDVTEYVRMTLSPGQVVAAKVVGKVCEGLNVVVGKQEGEKFYSSRILGRVRNFHLGDELVGDSKKKYQIGDVIKCRVLCCDSTSYVLLTNKQILVESSLPIISEFSQLKKNIITHGIITIISKTQTSGWRMQRHSMALHEHLQACNRNDVFFSAFVSLYNNVCGSIQLNNLHNDKRAQLRVGKVVVVRVKDFSIETEALWLSLCNDDDVINETESHQQCSNSIPNDQESMEQVSNGDVTDDVRMTLSPGQVVMAKVVRIMREGLNVVIFHQEGERFILSRIFGRIRNFHMADELVGDSKKDCQIGDVIKCRVLSCDSTSDVLLTNKQILVESSLPIISEFSQLEKNIITHGIITMISKTHAFVSLYNNVCGAIQLNNLHYVTRAQLRVRKVVVVRVKDFSIETEALWLSLCNDDDVINETESHEQMKNSVRFSNSVPNDQESVDKFSDGDVTDDVKMTLNPGQVVAAKVVEKVREGLNVVVGKQEDEEFISLKVFGCVRNFHVADEYTCGSEKEYQIGDVMKCRVLSYDATSGVYGFLLTNKKILVESSLPIISEFSQLKKNIITHGIITIISKTQAFVSFYNNVSGTLLLNHLLDEDRANIRLGKVVEVRVQNFSIETKRLVLSMRNDNDVINEPPPTLPKKLDEYSKLSRKQTKSLLKKASLASLLRKIESAQRLPELRKKKSFREDRTEVVGNHLSLSELFANTSAEDVPDEKIPKTLSRKMQNVLKRRPFVTMKVEEKSTDGLMVTMVNFLSKLTSIPIYHLSDFITIAKAKHALLEKGSILVGIVVCSRDMIVTLKENMVEYRRTMNEKLDEGEVAPGFIFSSTDRSVNIQTCHKAHGYCLKVNFFRRFVPDFRLYFTPGQSVSPKMKRKLLDGRRSRYEFGMQRVESYGKDRIVKYLDSFRKLNEYLPKDFKIEIGSLVEVESMLSVSGYCVVKECEDTEYQGLLISATAPKPGPAVVMFIDHTTKQLLLTNRKDVVESAQNNELPEIPMDTKINCVVLYMNCDITVGSVCYNEQYCGRLLFFATFPNENTMYEVQKCWYEVGTMVEVVVISYLNDSSKHALVCRENRNMKKTVFKERSEELTSNKRKLEGLDEEYSLKKKKST